ncbi:MAG: group 1 truncated hemoglobin [Rhodocyclales bacterium]|nr:group 1 truncated hemoglobin [Rhodocyclales bacterium]
MKQDRSRASGAQAVLFALFALLIAGSAAAQEKKSLYDRLGGAYPIAMVVDDFIDRLWVNKTLNANPAIKASRAAMPKPALKYQVTSFVTMATGGPQKYVGRDMASAHAHLNIKEKEWQAMIAEFRKTLKKFKVPEGEQKELIELLGTTKKDIVKA